MHKSQLHTAVTGFLIVFFFAISCTKIDNTTLGKDLIPGEDFTLYDTTLDVIVNNVDDLNLCDSVRRTDPHVLGTISNDPYFGSTSANIYMEFKPNVFPFSFPEHGKDSIYLDSMVMVLKYVKSFGDSTIPQTVTVYALENNFKIDTTYTTCDVFAYSRYIMGSSTFKPASLNDSIIAFRENSKNQLRIRIDNLYGEGWISSTSTFQSDSAFSKNNKGYAIVSNSEKGGQALSYFDLTHLDTRLSMYIRTQKDGKKDTSVIDFPMNAYSGEANSIVRNRNGSEISKQDFNNPNGNESIYIQTSPGTYATIKIPGLKGLGNRAIQRAELVMEQSYSTTTSDDIFTAPNYLYIDVPDTASSGKKYVTIPCEFNFPDVGSYVQHLGGFNQKFTNASGNQVKKYTFNISRYVQNVLNKKYTNDPVLRLRAPYYITNVTPYFDACNQPVPTFSQGLNNIAHGRVKLEGSTKLPSRMKLRIIYAD